MLNIITISKENLAGLQKTYASLQVQDNTNFRWIVVNGGGNDESAAWLEALDCGFELHHMSELDNGIYDAMNKGLDCISRISDEAGAFVWFLNAGDIAYDSGVVARINAAFGASEAVRFIYGDCWEEEHAEVLHYKKARSFSDIKAGMITHHQAMVYKFDAANANLRFDKSFRVAGDYDFTLRFLYRLTGEIGGYLPAEGVVSYVQHGWAIFEAGGVSQSIFLTGAHENYIIRNKLRSVSKFKNIRLFIVQIIANIIKHISPKLYWYIRGLF